MPRQRIGTEPMSPAERQARHRARLRGQSQTPPTPAASARPKNARKRGPPGALSRPERWSTAVATLVAVQEECRGWLDNLPANLEGSRLADKPQAICDFDLEELHAIEPPRGYGRD